MGHALRDLSSPLTETIILREGGRIVIPAAMRDALGVAPGDELLIATHADGSLTITTPKVALRKLQDFVRAQDRGTGSVVDELIADRRAEAAQD